MYEFEVRELAGNGGLTFFIPEGLVTDLAGNIILIDELTIYHDNEAPGKPRIYLSDSSLFFQTKEAGSRLVTRFAESKVSIDFGETVLNVDERSATCSFETANVGSCSSLQPQDEGLGLYSMVVTFEDDVGGEVNIRIPSGRITDLAGNPIVSGDLVLVRDLSSVGAVLTAINGNVTSSQFMTVNIDFQQRMVGFDSQSILLTLHGDTRGKIVGFDTLDDDQGLYQATVLIRSDEGSATLTVLEGNATNMAGTKTKSSSITLTRDAVGPSAPVIEMYAGDLKLVSSKSTNNGLASAEILYTNADKLRAVIIFEEDVVDFTRDSIALFSLGGVTGSLGKLQMMSPSTYSVPIWRLRGEGPVRMNVAAGAAKDTLGNPSVGAFQVLLRDVSPPSPPYMEPERDRFNGDRMAIYVEFDEPILDLQKQAFQLSRGSPSASDPVSGNILGSKHQATELFPLPGNIAACIVSFENIIEDGQYTVWFREGIATDQAGNFAPSSSAIFWKDTESPKPTISLKSDTMPGDSSEAMALTNQRSIVIHIDFREEVNVDLEQFENYLETSGLPAVLLYTAPRSSSEYAVAFVVAGKGSLEINLLAGAAEDMAGNPSESVKFTVLRQPEFLGKVKISAPARSTRASNLYIILDFGTPIAGLGLEDIKMEIEGGGEGTLISLEKEGDRAGVYNLTARATRDGLYSFSYGSEATDLAGNAVPPGEITIIRDTSEPQILVLEATNGGFTNHDYSNLLITFDELVVWEADLQIICADGVSGTIRQQPLPVRRGVRESFNRLRRQANPMTIRRRQPSDSKRQRYIHEFEKALQAEVLEESRNGLLSLLADASPFFETEDKVSVSFELPSMLDVAMSDPSIIIGLRFNAKVSDLTGEGECTVIIPEGAALDLAGNPSTSRNITIARDTVSPAKPILTSSVGELTNADEFTVFISYEEPVYQFKADNISLFYIGEHVLMDLRRLDPSSFAVDVKGLVYDAAYTLSFPSGSAVDRAGNPAPGGSITVIRDTVAKLSMYATEATAKLDVFTVYLDFGEPVKFFSPSAIMATMTSGEGGNVVVELVEASNELGEFTLSVLTPFDGVYRVSMESKQVVDYAGNHFEPKSVFIRRDTRLSQKAAVSTSAGQSTPWGDPPRTNADAFTLTVDFESPVIGFDEKDVRLVYDEGLAVARMKFEGPIGQTKYLIFVTISAGQGPFTVEWSEGAAEDDRGVRIPGQSFTVIRDLGICFCAVSCTFPTMKDDNDCLTDFA